MSFKGRVDKLFTLINSINSAVKVVFVGDISKLTGEQIADPHVIYIYLEV